MQFLHGLAHSSVTLLPEVLLHYNHSSSFYHNRRSRVQHFPQSRSGRAGSSAAVRPRCRRRISRLDRPFEEVSGPIPRARGGETDVIGLRRRGDDPARLRQVLSGFSRRLGPRRLATRTVTDTRQNTGKHVALLRLLTAPRLDNSDLAPVVPGRPCIRWASSQHHRSLSGGRQIRVA